MGRNNGQEKNWIQDLEVVSCLQEHGSVCEGAGLARNFGEKELTGAWRASRSEVEFGKIQVRKDVPGILLSALHLLSYLI